MLRFPRPIRSYVRRNRMSSEQRQALNVLWDHYGLSLSDDFQAFLLEKPCVLEIGFGMGSALIAMAQAFPEKNFIGIDVHRPGVGAVLAAIDHFKLKNIRLFSIDAIEVLSKSIPDETFTSICIFFPDPWPKRRHHKRRLIQPSFISLLERKLVQGGDLYMATDWQDYAEQMLGVMHDAAGFKNLAGVNQYSIKPDFRLPTKFEQRGLALGHKVWDLHFKKN